MQGENGRWRRRQNLSDPAAFNAWCADVAPPLYSYVLRHVPQPADAEDISQEALFRLFQVLRAKRVRKDPRAYVFSIAHNLIADFHQKARPIEAPGRREAPSPERDAERSLLAVEVSKALEDLPPPQRSALLLREYGGLSYEDIAATLGATQPQVKIWIYRARRRLADLLDRDGQYIGGNRHA